MASLTKRATSVFWVACFTDANGRRLKRSTKTTDRKLAQKIADQFELATRSKRTAMQARNVIASLHREITGTDLPETSTKDFIVQWLEERKPEVEASTLKFYRSALDRFQTMLAEKSQEPIAAVTKSDILAFRNAEAEVTAAKTVNHKLKVLRMLFKSAKRDSLILEDPTEFVDTLKRTTEGTKKAFSVPQLRELLALADPEWKSMILAGIYTGQRLGDIATLAWESVDMRQNCIRLRSRKTKAHLVIPIAEPLRNALIRQKAAHSESAYVHPKAAATYQRQAGSSGLSNQFAVLVAQAGLRPKQPHRKKDSARDDRTKESSGLSFHSLRHSTVTLLKEAGVPHAVVMELVGHESKSVSQIYTHVGDEALMQAIDKLPML